MPPSRIRIIDEKEVSGTREQVTEIAHSHADRTGCPVEILEWHRTNIADENEGQYIVRTTIEPRVRKRPLV